MARLGNARKDGYQTNAAAVYERRVYRERKERGECPSCGKQPPQEGYTQCSSCRARKNRNSKKRNRKVYRQMIKLNICGMCKQREAMTNRKWCGVCSELHTERSAALRDRRRAEGKCTRCGGEKPCEKCLARGREKTAKYQRRKRERLAKGNAGKAPGTGVAA